MWTRTHTYLHAPSLPPPPPTHTCNGACTHTHTCTHTCTHTHTHAHTHTHTAHPSPLRCVCSHTKDIPELWWPIWHWFQLGLHNFGCGQLDYPSCNKPQLLFYAVIFTTSVLFCAFQTLQFCHKHATAISTTTTIIKRNTSWAVFEIPRSIADSCRYKDHLF